MQGIRDHASRACESDEGPPPPRAGYVSGRRGYADAVQSGLGGVEGWRVEVVFWDADAPRWHEGVVVDEMQAGPGGAVMAHVFYEADAVDEHIEVDDPTLAWRRSTLSRCRIDRERLHQIRAAMNAER